MPNKDWKDCSITLNFSDTKSLFQFGKYVGHLPEYLEMWTLDDDAMKEVNAFCEVMRDEEEVTISSPLIDGGDAKTLFGMEMYLKEGRRLRTMREYMDSFKPKSKEAN